MIKRIFLFLAGIYFLAVSLESAVSEYNVYRKGEYLGKVTVYQIDDRVYLESREFSKIIKAKRYIYSVSRKILFSINGRKLSVSRVDSTVNYDDIIEQKFQNPILVRANRYFVLSDIFTGENFSRIFELKIEVDSKNKRINIYEDMNITAVKYFSYLEKTRIVFYMSRKLEYKIDTTNNNLTLTILNGSYIKSNEKIEVGDGVLNSIDITQKEKALKVRISLSENYENYESFTLTDPHRIVIDLKSRKKDIEEKIEIKEILPSTSDNSIKESTGPRFELPDKLRLDNEVKVIVIDPGHGGKDPGGRIKFGKKEKQINFEIALKLYDLLRRDKRFKVIITRNRDIFIPLYERSKIANDAKADLFISIHGNAHKSSKENGFEIYFLSEKATDPWASEVADYENASITYEDGVFDYSDAALVLHSIARNEYINEGSKLAAYVRKNMKKYTPFKDRGIKQAAFYVLRYTYAPGILIEVGFMTNTRDKKNLDSSYVQKKVALAIYEGVMDYAKANNWIK